MKLGCPAGSKHNHEGLRCLRNCTNANLAARYTKGATTADIAASFGVSQTAVRSRFKSAGIVFRTLGERETAKNVKRTLPLSEPQRQLILGSLLGDACLFRQNCVSATGTPFFTLKVLFAHGEDQLPYLEHKRQVLLRGREGLDKPCVSKIGTRPDGSNLGKQISQFAFSHTPSLLPFAEMCHDADHHKHVTEEWAEQLGIQGLAYWYQDDGCLTHEAGTRNATLRWYTNAFSNPELEILKAVLRRFGAKSITEAEGNNDPTQRVLCVNRFNDICVLLEQVRPFIVPILNYKIRCIL
jgi:hypothetical protein